MSDIAPEPGDAIKFDELPLSAAVLRGLVTTARLPTPRGRYGMKPPPPPPEKA